MASASSLIGKTVNVNVGGGMGADVLPPTTIFVPNAGPFLPPKIVTS